MEKHSAAITAEKKQREALARQTEKQMRNQVGGTGGAVACVAWGREGAMEARNVNFWGSMEIEVVDLTEQAPAGWAASWRLRLWSLIPRLVNPHSGTCLG